MVVVYRMRCACPKFEVGQLLVECEYYDLFSELQIIDTLWNRHHKKVVAVVSVAS